MPQWTLAVCGCYNLKKEETQSELGATGDNKRRQDWSLSCQQWRIIPAVCQCWIFANDKSWLWQTIRSEILGPLEEKESVLQLWNWRCVNGWAWNRRNALDQWVHLDVRLCDKHRCGMIAGMFNVQVKQKSTFMTKWRNDSDNSRLMGWQCWWWSPWSLGCALGERAMFVWRSWAEATMQTVDQCGHNIITTPICTCHGVQRFESMQGSSTSPKECLRSVVSIPWGTGGHLWSSWRPAESTRQKSPERSTTMSSS